MATITDSITIAATPTRVWELLADMTAASRYSPSVSTVQLLTDRTEGLGAERLCRLSDGGFFKERVVSWTPEHEIALEIFEANGPLAAATGTFTLTPSREGTTDVRCRMEYKLRYGPIGALMAATIAKGQFRKLVRGLLAGIKSEVERHPRLDPTRSVGA